MTPEEVRGSGYQKPEAQAGISAAGRAFLEALARRKRARGEEVPPIYQQLLGFFPEAPLTPEEVQEHPQGAEAVAATLPPPPALSSLTLGGFQVPQAFLDP